MKEIFHQVSHKILQHLLLHIGVTIVQDKFKQIVLISISESKKMQGFWMVVCIGVIIVNNKSLKTVSTKILAT